jgi:UDP-glucose 4-epimerase
MKVVIFGGTGFVGLNLAGTLLSRGHHVTLYDRTQLPATAARSLADYGERLRVVQGDITDTKRIEALIAEDCDTIVLGAAITAGAHLPDSRPVQSWGAGNPAGARRQGPPVRATTLKVSGPGKPV